MLNSEFTPHGGSMNLSPNVSTTQIMVTPEMIEAGLGPYFSFEDGADDPQRLVRDVFRAMLASWQQSNSKMSKITEYLHDADLRELESDEYARLLRLAHDEGRLSAILQRAGLQRKVMSDNASTILLAYLAGHEDDIAESIEDFGLLRSVFLESHGREAGSRVVTPAAGALPSYPPSVGNSSGVTRP